MTGPNRNAEIDAFLESNNWRTAKRDLLAQDASSRRYFRLFKSASKTAILMDSPILEDSPCPVNADDSARIDMGWSATTRLAASRVEAFTAMSAHLRGLGMSAPQIIAEAPELGLCLLEDFGQGREFARLIENGAAIEDKLYIEAGKALAHFHKGPTPTEIISPTGKPWRIQAFDRLALDASTDIFADWVGDLDPTFRLDDKARRDYDSIRDNLVSHALELPREFTLRDYHAENLLWLHERKGVARIGLLDFQDAIIGWDAWDLDLLTYDARRPVSESARKGAIHAYLSEMGKTETDFQTRLAVIGTLNALRIVGIFSRLIHRDGKPRYGQFLPRQIQSLAAHLDHPATTEMQRFIHTQMPHLLTES